MHAAVPPIAGLMDTLSHEVGTYHYVVDVANAFFSIDIEQECQEQIAFTGKAGSGHSLFLQGYLHSPICHGLVAQDLAKWKKRNHKWCSCITALMILC